MDASIPSPDGTVPDSPGVYVKPPRIFQLCLVAGLILEYAIPTAIPAIPKTARLVSGAALAAAGFAFMMWGHTLFTRLGVNVKTILPASRLVTAGAYRRSRNPMYVGFLAILVGLGLALGSVWMVLTAVPMALYLGLYVVPREEAYLARRFGPDYETYRRNVRRWL
ncbi:MAG: isoprenylcysteine carboxylmethyltransferase family protein [Desulfovibrio sp.]|nr:isoprenylcysteine carboxylmethyltransferase family protein [Desulfovibrio sp.]